LNYAVNKIGALPNAKIYLDSTHSDWLGIADAADHLVKAGVKNADGFFLNVSNYQFTQNSIQYGTWVSKCIDQPVKTDDTCANKFWNGGPLDGFASGTGLTPNAVWVDSPAPWTDPSVALNTFTGNINTRLAGQTGTTHFVIDTSRNGVGPWVSTASYPDAQNWCNPLDRASASARR
jgi:endoglucanase